MNYRLFPAAEACNVLIGLREVKMEKKGIRDVFMVMIVLAGILMASSCSTIVSTPIRKIIENPRDYSGKAVVVRGEVTEIFGLFFVKYFVLNDNTGEITVVTQRPLPKKGTKIRVKGTVQEAFSLGDQQLIVIVEEAEGK